MNNEDIAIMDHDCSYERDEIDDLRLSLEYFRNLTAVHGQK